MRKLLIRTSYEVLLWHFVDSISQWSVFVSEHLPQFYEREFGYTKEDKKILKQYIKIRKPLEWDKESDLFDWAYEKFPDNPKFDKLRPLVLYFENRVSKNNHTLKQLLLSRERDIKRIRKYIDILLYKDTSKIDKTIKKMSKLLEYNDDNNDPVLTYLACSMSGSIQGSANGSNIYSEVGYNKKHSWDKTSAKSVYTVLIHEYLHKSLRSRRYFKNLGGIFNYKNENIYPEIMAYFFNEVITYSLSNVYIQEENPKDKYKHYINDPRHLVIMQTANNFAPHIVAYMEDKVSMEDTRKIILDLCEKTVEEFKKK